MLEKYLLFSLDEEKAKKLGEVISSQTCKRIVNLLAEKDASESDIAKELKLPLNTVDYNIKKLLESSIIEKSKNFFWSTKGKKIEIYKVANKLIVISPKKSNIYSKLKGVVPVALISGILTAFLYWYYKSANFTRNTMEKTSNLGIESALNVPTTMNEMAKTGVSTSSLPWLWFLIGSLVAIIAFLIWNWKKM